MRPRQFPPWHRKPDPKPFTHLITMIPQSAISDLARKICGRILQAGDAAYDAVVKIDNGRVQRRPRIIIQPQNYSDVAETLKFAIAHQAVFTVKGGGHSAAGYCLNDNGIVLDMRPLNKISYDSKKQTLTAQMGVIWYDVYKYMVDTGTGLFPVGGGCPTVAPPGFMQGGGYSFVSRSYGMSIDNLEGMKVVTPDGKLRHVGHHSKTAEDKDLFWALRGGGGGNFGIVLEMEMRMQPPRTEKMLVGQIRYPLERAGEVLSYYNEWVEKIPDEMSCYGFCGHQPDAINKSANVKVLGLTPVFNGDWAKGMELIKGLTKFAPIYADLRNMTLPEWEFYNGTTTLVANRSAYIRSSMVPAGGMGLKTAKVFMDYMNACPSPYTFAVWTLGGGAISKHKSDETAFYHREAKFIPEVKSIWDADSPGDARANVEWAYDFFEDLNKASGATGAYVNYIDPLQTDWARMYYGSNYKRLLKIKKQIDPKNVFSFLQSIGSPFEPDGRRPLDLNPLNRTV
ncbi:MAG: hypothetical protein RIS79_272 [Verrucomicrobiota bacterium]